MIGKRSLEELWASALRRNAERALFDPSYLAALPAAAQRYLRHSIAGGLPLAAAVRLRMHGEIRLKGWYPFTAEQVIDWKRGMIWQAVVRVHGLPVCGADSFLDGLGVMRWKMMGIIPVMQGQGADISRSAAGRLNIESVWLPSVFCSNQVTWSSSDSSQLQVCFPAHNEEARISMQLAAEGGLVSVVMPRWGNPDGETFRYEPFGCLVEEERTFGGYTIPARMRAGWYFGSPRFEPAGEFFRVVLDDAVYC